MSFSPLKKSFSVFLVALILSCNSKPAQSQSQQKQTVQKQNPVPDENAQPNAIRVLQRWEMPTNLTEISGISTYKNLLAAIQDEDGIIFLFNPATGKVEKQIPFAGPGDYEGIAIVGETAWVIRADGQLFEVQDFAGKSPLASLHPTIFGKKQDTEGLCYEAAKNRLLISVKGKDLTGGEGKGVYAFDLSTMRLIDEPVYRIIDTDGLIPGNKKKKSGTLRPSEITLHPTTGTLYVLDGPANMLFTLKDSGAPEKVYLLDQKDFPQAEGLAFSADGTLYISTEGQKGRGAILQVGL